MARVQGVARGWRLFVTGVRQCNRRPTMSAQIIKAASAGSLFASWMSGAARVLGHLDFELSRPCASIGQKRSVEGKVDCVAVEAGAMKHCQH